MASTLIYITSLALALFAAFIVYTLRPKSHRALHRVGLDPGFFNQNLPAAKRYYQLNGRQLIKEAYKKHKDKNFVVQTGDQECIVISPNFLPEIRMLPESKANHTMALVDRFMGSYTGVDVMLKSRGHHNVCRLQLNQSLQYQQARQLFLAKYQGVSKNVPAYAFVLSMVLAITSRVFVGKDLARNPAWQEVVTSNTMQAVSTAKALKPYPRILRPLIRPFAAPQKDLDAVYERAEEVILQPILDRKNSKTRDEAPDLLMFLVQDEEEGRTKSTRVIIGQLFMVLGASLHTSTMAVVQAVYDLCSMPQLIHDLRSEARTVLAQEGRKWTLNAIRNLRLLDSFLKESLRWNSPEVLGLTRITTVPLHLSDGTFIPAGSFIAMAADAMSRDADFYTDPDIFKARRFYGTDDAQQEYAGIQTGNIAWGSGRSTCPGRWYASSMNKLIIADLLLHFEVSFPEGQTTRPESTCNDGSIVPHPTQEIELKPL